MYCMKPLVTVSMETEQCKIYLICDCMTRHRTQPVGKVSDLYYLRFLRYRDLNLTATTTRSKRIGKIIDNRGYVAGIGNGIIYVFHLHYAFRILGPQYAHVSTAISIELLWHAVELWLTI